MRSLRVTTQLQDNGLWRAVVFDDDADASADGYGETERGAVLMAVSSLFDDEENDDAD